MAKKFGSFTFLRETDDIEKMKNFKLVNRLGYYDICINKSVYIFIDCINLRTFAIKSKKNLFDETVMEDLITIYQFIILPYYK